MRAQTIDGVVYHRSGADFLARVIDSNGGLVATDDVASVSYTVRPIDPCDGGFKDPVAGHDGVSLTPSSVFYDVLQVGGVWTADDVGFNFRHSLDTSVTEAFPEFERAYLVRFEIELEGGETIVSQFRVRTV